MGQRALRRGASDAAPVDYLPRVRIVNFFVGVSVDVTLTDTRLLAPVRIVTRMVLVFFPLIVPDEELTVTPLVQQMLNVPLEPVRLRILMVVEWPLVTTHGLAHVVVTSNLPKAYVLIQFSYVEIRV